MPLELKQLRLPSEWGTDEDKNSPRLFLRNAYKLDLPISGGWGYGVNDCVVIDKEDPAAQTGLPFDLLGVENVFVEKRIYAELIVFRPRNDRFSGISWNRTEQSLRDIDGRAFDVLKYQVTAFTDRDWEFLRLDWEQNDAYLSDEAGKVRHAEERSLRECYYNTEFWFDISSPFGE